MCGGIIMFLTVYGAVLFGPIYGAVALSRGRFQLTRGTVLVGRKARYAGFFSILAALALLVTFIFVISNIDMID